MNLSAKLILVFISIVLLSVGSSLIALREMNRLEGSIKHDIQVVVPVRAALAALNERVDDLRSGRLKILLPEQTFGERWSYLQQYKGQYADFQALQDKLNVLLASESLPETSRLWKEQSEKIQTWETLFKQLDLLFQRWFADGVANPGQLYMLLEGFEREQTAQVTDLHKKVLNNVPLPPLAETITDDVSPLQLWLDRFSESRRLLDEGSWDGVRPRTLADGSPVNMIAKSDVLANQVARMRELYVPFRRALDRAKAALAADQREAAVAALAECLVLNSDMLGHFHAMHGEARKILALKEELQGVSRKMEDIRSEFQKNMVALTGTTDHELNAQSDSAVASVEKTKSLLWILLGGFVVLSFVLGAYMMFEFRRSRAAFQGLQREREAAYAEMHFLFNTFSMGCLLRDENYTLMNCNLAAAKLFGIEEQWNEMEENAQAFGLKDKWEYLARYAELVYPELQPDGSLSKEKAHRLFRQALEEGRVQTEWLYQMPDGSPLPAEVTLQRAEWGGSRAVVYHIRDLRAERGLLNGAAPGSQAEASGTA